MAFCALVSVLISGWTVREMIKDRDAAYSPDIVMNPVKIYFSWNNTNDDGVCLSEGIYEPLEHEEQVLSFQTVVSGYFNNYSIVNIGVGPAKEVCFTWDSGNTQKLCDFLTTYAPSKHNFCKIGNGSVSFYYENSKRLVQVEREETTSLMYMLPVTETDEKYSIAFPEAYTILIQEIVKTVDFLDNAPCLLLTVSGKDIHDNYFEKQIIISIKLIR